MLITLNKLTISYINPPCAKSFNILILILLLIQCILLESRNYTNLWKDAEHKKIHSYCIKAEVRSKENRKQQLLNKTTHCFLNCSPKNWKLLTTQKVGLIWNKRTTPSGLNVSLVWINHPNLFFLLLQFPLQRVKLVKGPFLVRRKIFNIVKMTNESKT